MTDHPHADLIHGLRDLADWLEAHPEAPEVYQANVQFLHGAGAQELARLMAPCEKDWSESLLTLRRSFGPVHLVSHHWRTEVCTRRIVGTTWVEEKIIPAHRQEVVEWDCHPILRDLADETPRVGDRSEVPF